MRETKKTKVNIDEKKLNARFEKAARKTAKTIAGFVIAQAVEHYIPYGYTGELAKSLRERVKSKNGKVYIELEAQINYAKKIHDTKLRHASQPANRDSFMNYGSGTSDEAQYWAGYENKKASAPKYATKFFSKPMEFVVANINRFVNAFKNEFGKKNG